MESSFGIFQGQWYKSISGISTDSSISVQLANITVYYVLRKVIYNTKLNDQVVKDGLRRFIDDGVGLFIGTIEEFMRFSQQVTLELAKYGLIIEPGEWNFATLPSDAVRAYCKRISM